VRAGHGARLVEGRVSSSRTLARGSNDLIAARPAR